MKKAAIIVAGGKGLRMGTDTPKQYLLLNGKPILMHTIERFYHYDPSIHIIVVLPFSDHQFWETLCREHNFAIPMTLARGGESRFESVKNGLFHLKARCLVAVHDGVRPFVDNTLLDRCFEAAGIHRAILPAIEVIDTVRELTPLGSKTVNRANYRLVQTPQVFDSELLIEAYHQPSSPYFTDDASVVEAAGTEIFLVEGRCENIKITTPFDLSVATLLLTEGGIKSL